MMGALLGLALIYVFIKGVTSEDRRLALLFIVLAMIYITYLVVVFG